MMFCQECLDHKKTNAMTTGCQTFKTSSMSRHEASEDHQSVLKSRKLKETMDEAIKKAHSEADKALIKAMKVVYWLVTENVALSKYESLMQLVKDLGVDLAALKIGTRIDYESYYSAKEILKSLSDDIDERVTRKLQDSPVLTILADESTDIGNRKRMVVNARVIDPKTSKTETLYLRNFEYEGGSGEDLCAQLVNEVERRGVDMRKVTGFGSDGASVMSGLDKGVAGRLRELNPHMIHIHCMAHRLALCTSQAATAISPIKKYQEWLTSLFYYFKVSATRAKEVQKIQEVLDHPALKYREVRAVRWLSIYEAVEAVYRTLD